MNQTDAGALPKTLMSDISLEIQMYQPVATFLKKSCDCVHVCVDRPEDPKKLHLPANLNKRDRDIVGVTKERQVYIAEGKCLRSGESFDQCVNQAQSLSAYADYLYVFFPRKKWESLPQDDEQRNRKSLRDKGIGLLLVDDLGKCVEKLPPRQNVEAEEAKKIELRRSMGIEEPEGVPKLSCLGSTEAAVAIKIVDCFMDYGRNVAGEAIDNVFNRKVKDWKPEIVKEKAVIGGFFFFANFDEETFGVDLDVFGGYLGDGHSCIWVTRKVECAVLLRRLETRSPDFGTHLFFGERGFVPSLRDVKPERIRESDEKEFWLMHRVEFFGRSRDGLRMELEDLLTAARRLK